MAAQRPHQRGEQPVLRHFHGAYPKADMSEPTASRSTSTSQVLTVYKQGNRSSHHDVHRKRRKFCGGTDGCQYAITPVGHYQFHYLRSGWGTAASGASRTRSTSTAASRCTDTDCCHRSPASHGCARIPCTSPITSTHSSTKGESVFVVGTPKQRRQRLRRSRTQGQAAAATTTVPNATPPPAAYHTDHQEADNTDHQEVDDTDQQEEGAAPLGSRCLRAALSFRDGAGRSEQRVAERPIVVDDRPAAEPRRHRGSAAPSLPSSSWSCSSSWPASERSR